MDVGGGRMMLAGNLFRSGKVYYDFLNIFVQKPYTLASGEVSWAPNDRWRVSLWGKNLTNEAVYQQVKPGGPATDVLYEPPRQIGVGAEFRF